MNEKLIIDTPEQIGLEFELATIGSRSLAMAVDTLIQAGVMILLGIAALIDVLLAGPGGRLSPWIVAAGVLVSFVLWYGYFLAFEIAWRGQTPGKRVVGVRVIGDTGRPLTPQQSVIRNLVRIADSLPALYAIGIATTLLTSRHQRLGDLAAGTVVVLERRAAPPRKLYDEVTGLEGARLTQDELAIVEAFLRRREDLDWTVREQTAARIAVRLRARLGLGSGGSDEDLLERAAAAGRANAPVRR